MKFNKRETFNLNHSLQSFQESFSLCKLLYERYESAAAGDPDVATSLLSPSTLELGVIEREFSESEKLLQGIQQVVYNGKSIQKQLFSCISNSTAPLKISIAESGSLKALDPLQDWPLKQTLQFEFFGEGEPQRSHEDEPNWKSFRKNSLVKVKFRRYFYFTQKCFRSNYINERVRASIVPNQERTVLVDKFSVFSFYGFTSSFISLSHNFLRQ